MFSALQYITVVHKTQ